MPRKISAVIIDTYANKKLPTLAIEKTLECNRIGKVYTFSDAPYFDGAEFVSIPKITSIKEYEKWVLAGVLDFVEEDFLIIQWDGFVVQPSKWNEEFENYDYIGAPYIYEGNSFEVGNGGFSYRSLKLMNAIAEVQSSGGILNTDLPEDVLLCREYRIALEKMGVQFAPVGLASQFSFQQDGLPVDFENLFGFHSPWNFPRFFTEESMLPIVDDMIERMTNFRVFVTYLEQCRTRGMNQLFSESIKSVNKYPNIVEIINQNFVNKVDPHWAERLIKVMTG
jgi:hypothetical protein